MNRSAIYRYTSALVCFAVFTPAILAQNSILVFSPVNVRLSANGTSYSSPNTFNSATLNLSCPAGIPIVATLSSTASGTGNVLVDNFVSVAVGSNGSLGTPVNVCTGGTSDSTQNGTSQNCFNTNYQSSANAGTLTGQDPDNFASTGGVAPIDIHSNFSPGSMQLQINLVDGGGYLASSSIYLDTNCSQAGVSGPASVTGNPISQSNPTPQQLTQTFTFNSTVGQGVQFVYDLSQAATAQNGTLTIQDGTIPGTEDLPVDPNTFQSAFENGTSFATSSCLIHTGETLSSGAQACKLFTLECSVGTGTTESGAQCPVSSLPNEVFQDIFDGPGFSLTTITPTGGPTFHEGIGLLMASEPWTGGPCTFDSNSGLQNLPCPQNILATFSGPGSYTATGKTSHPNSTFIPVAGVPEDLTTVIVAGQQAGGWINKQTFNVTLSSQPPNLAGSGVSNANNFVASPIQSITYGISTAANVPQPSAPPSTDTTVANPITCPQAPSASDAIPYSTGPQSITVPADGNYLLHYYAQDCAGTQELQFTDPGGIWATSYYTFPINVDTVAPAITPPGPTLSPAPGANNSYYVGQAVTASYECTDDRSGIVACGASTFSPNSAVLNTGLLSSHVNTSTAGTQTYTVTAIDAAGNRSSASVNYTVAATQKVPSSSTKCNGTYTGTFNGNLTISAGQTCVFVSGGATGNATNNGGTFALTNSTLGGNLVENKGSLSLSQSRIGGNVQVDGGTFAINPGTVIGGNLQVQGLSGGTAQNQVCGSVVHGELVVQQNGAAVVIGTPSCAGNSIGGNLQVQSNSGATAVGANTISGNLQDNSNRGPTQVFNNTIRGILQCQQNSSITGGGNKAQLKQGQCAAF